MKAVVLCGGKGMRLRPYTHTVPKSMLVLGRKPILQYVVEYLRREGVRDVVFTVGHMRDRIMSHFKDGKRYGVSIKYAEEDEELGTAGSVLNAQPLVKDDDFIVLMSDQLTNVSLKKVMAYHKEKKAIATIGLKRMGVPLQFGTVDTRADGLVMLFKEKPILQYQINSGIYALNEKAFEYLPERGDFAMDVFPAMMRKRERLFGYVFDDYWIDVGNLHDYERINQTLSLVDLITQK